MERTVNDWAQRINDWSQRKGWWNLLPQEVIEEVGEDLDRYPKLKSYLFRTLIHTKLLLIVTEVAEAMEELRAGRGLREVNYSYVEGRGDVKPEGFPVEYADGLIRYLDLGGQLGFDVDSLLSEKMGYNETRPYRHGGKEA